MERVDQQLRLNCFRESCARIDYRLPRDGIRSVLFKFFHARGDSRKLLRGNARQFPCDLRRVDLEEGEAQVLTRAGEHLSGWKDQARLFRSKRGAPARFRRESVAAVALKLRRNGDFVTLFEIEVACDYDLFRARKKFHLLNRRLDMDSFRRRFYGIDRVVEFDSNHRVFEWVIERAEPLHLERFGFANGHYLQIGKRSPAFRFEQAIHDQVECLSDWKRGARSDSKPRRFQRTSFLFSRLNYFDWKTQARLPVLKVNVLCRFIEANCVC